MKQSNDIVGNRTRELQACSAVPQPTASKCGRTSLKLLLKLQSKLEWYIYIYIYTYQTLER